MAASHFASGTAIPHDSPKRGIAFRGRSIAQDVLHFECRVCVTSALRRGVEEDDAQLIEFLHSIDLQVLLVATKIDKISLSEANERIARIQKESGLPVIGYSSAANRGRDELWKALLDLCSIVLAPKPKAEAPAKNAAPKKAPAKKAPAKGAASKKASAKKR